MIGGFSRITNALSKRARLWLLRAEYSVRGVTWGEKCDVRRGLHLVVDPRARLQVGVECILDRDMTIEILDEGVLQIGARTIFGHHCTIGVRERVLIGDDCLLAEMVSIRDHDHRFDDLEIPIREQGVVCDPVSIGNNVWLGAKVTVLKGVTIGDNAIIGANAVVTKDIPANAIAVGVPARVVKMRGDSGNSGAPSTLS